MMVEGATISALPMLGDNTISYFDDIDIRWLYNKYDRDGIDESVLDNWYSDPWFTLLFTDATGNILKFEDKRMICRIYLSRPEYKQVDINTDLILTDSLLSLFLTMTIPDKPGSSSYLYTVLCMANMFMIDKYGKGIQMPDTLPNYTQLPVVNSKGDIEYSFKGVKSI